MHSAIKSLVVFISIISIIIIIFGLLSLGFSSSNKTKFCKEHFEEGTISYYECDEYPLHKDRSEILKELKGEDDESQCTK